MLSGSLIFLVLSMMAAIFGFGGIAEASAEIAKFLFFIFISLFVISLVTGFMEKSKGSLNKKH